MMNFGFLFFFPSRMEMGTIGRTGCSRCGLATFFLTSNPNRFLVFHRSLVPFLKRSFVPPRGSGLLLFNHLWMALRGKGCMAVCLIFTFFTSSLVIVLYSQLVTLSRGWNGYGCQQRWFEIMSFIADGSRLFWHPYQI